MKNIEQIKAHLDGNTSDQEYSRFKQRLKTDPTFADEVAFYLNTKSKINDIILDQRVVPFYQNKVVWWSAAAAVVLMASSFGIYNYPEKALTPGQLLGRIKTSAPPSVLADTSSSSLKKAANTPSKKSY
jgi:hypothetical protein